MNEVDRYISQYDPEIQERLETLRQVFFDVLPDVKECIRYNMPAFKVGKNYLYFAAYKKHIGFYPIYGLPEIEAEIEDYKAKKTKDSLHFPHDKPMPLALVEKIIQLKNL